MSMLSTADPLPLAVGVLTLSLVLLAIAYPDRYVATRALRGVPGPRGLPVVGNLLHVLPWTGRTLEWLKFLVDTYGPLCTFTLPKWGRGILINRPEWLAHIKQYDMQRYSRGPKEVAIFTEFPGKKTPIASEGPEWRHARKAMLPIFTVKSFTEHVSLAMNEIIPATRALLLDASKKDVPIDWNDLAGRIALTIFTRSAMDLDVGLITPDASCLQRNDPLCDALGVLNTVSSRRLLNPFWQWTELFTGDRTRFLRARSYVRNLVENIISTREAQASQKVKETSDQHADWLSAMLKDPTFNDPALIRDTLVALLFAGRDNTQNAFAWSLYSLMGSREWIDRMRAEAKANRKPGREMEYGDLSRYHVHLAVFYETVRLWPGVPKNGRLALCDDVLPAIPEHNLPEVKVEKGDFLFWSDYHMMRNEAVWGPMANVFDPSRHLDEDGFFVRPAAPNFNGFGQGPRFCPAAQLAAYEFVACWAGFWPSFDFEHFDGPNPAGGVYERPRMTEAFTPSLSGPFMVKVRLREGEDAVAL
ncbi:cytochrome P450 [Trametes maxima]|nr:cytochrome P450 [Trametes maxima]